MNDNLIEIFAKLLIFELDNKIDGDLKKCIHNEEKALLSLSIGPFSSSVSCILLASLIQLSRFEAHCYVHFVRQSETMVGGCSYCWGGHGQRTKGHS